MYIMKKIAVFKNLQMNSQILLALFKCIVPIAVPYLLLCEFILQNIFFYSLDNEIEQMKAEEIRSQGKHLVCRTHNITFVSKASVPLYLETPNMSIYWIHFGHVIF